MQTFYSSIGLPCQNVALTEELIAKYLKSKKTFEQVMAFLDEEDENNEE